MELVQDDTTQRADDDARKNVSFKSTNKKSGTESSSVEIDEIIGMVG